MRVDVVAAAVTRTGGEVVPARAQMATTLGFHIILACLGIALPTFVLLAEFIGLRRSNAVAMTLARRWSQAMGVLVAVGAVTGTVLSFEMGLLWPGLMRQYGAVLGLPFGIEGLFFFLEAIFTAIYLYGWRRLPGWAHWWTGVPIAVSGIFGAMSVIAVNAWMNQPGGFTIRDGQITSVNAWQVFFNHAAVYEMPHMILAAYMVTGFTVAGVYAAGILRGRRDRYHYAGFALGFVPSAVLTPFQIFVGDTAARAIAQDQPVKFASMEYVAHTSRSVPEWLGGVYVNGHIYGGLRIPDMDSLLVGFSPGTPVTGWDSVPPAAAASGVADPPVLRSDGRPGVPAVAGRVVGGLGVVAASPVAAAAAVLAAGGGERPGCDRGHGMRLGGYRGRPPAVGGLPAPDHRGRRDDQWRRHRQLERGDRVVRGARCRDDPDPADAGPPLAAHRRERGRRSLRAAGQAAGPDGRPGRAVIAAAAVGGILLASVSLYAILGGADFGGGLWDLLAGGDQRGRAPRALIDESITPVWEANHVWLVFDLVIFWTAFPHAFAAVMTAAALPLWLALLGIVLRGAGFAFRKEVNRLSLQRIFGATFAFSSLLTPFFMGTVIGAIATGQIPATASHASQPAWTSATSLLTGLLFVGACGYLAAVYLAGEAAGRGDHRLDGYFARRGQVAGIVTGALSLATLAELHTSNPALFSRLTGRALPLVIIAGLCGLAVLALLTIAWRNRVWVIGVRVIAALGVAAVIWGWGVAQYPVLLPGTTVTLTNAGAPHTTLVAIIWVFAAAVVLVGPAFALLFYLQGRSLLHAEDPELPPAGSPGSGLRAAALALAIVDALIRALSAAEAPESTAG